MKYYTSDNPVFSDKILIVERADLVNYANKTESDKQLLQNDLVLKKRMDKYLGSDDNTEGPEFAEGIQSEDVIGAINEVFQLGSEKKKQLVENLTALGITASTGETWETLLNKVLSLINTSSDTVTTETLLSGYTAHNATGAKITGTLADKTGTTDYNAEASIDGTNKRLKLKVPATGKYSVGNYLYAAYTTIANLIGLTAAKLVKGNTILGITGSNNNMDTSGADAGAGDILAGKKAGVKGSLITGTMPNKGAWTGATTGNGNVTIPAGYHNGQGHVSGAGAYNAGVSAADGRVNADSANYKGGYNAGVSATKKGTAGAGDVLSGKTFTNGSSVGASGTMPNKGAWTGATTGSGNVTIPAGYHNGQGHVSGAGAYNKGVTDADARVNANSANYKGGYNAGVSATKKGTAGAGDVLSGKTFTNGSIVEASGTMANKGSTTQDATATQDDTYTYLTVPVAGYYNTASKLRTKNSNISTGFTIDRITVSEIDSTGGGAACYSQKISFSGLKTMTIGSHSGTDYFIATLSNGKKYNLTKNGQVIDISDCTYVSFSTSWIGAEGGESASISNIVFS
ncbi:MAG: hypothetical protein OSJ73_10505 [Lachnospiraceae bacterium]|nr:hypothetical protein [Lachnospiraceae bacterium]